MTINSIITAGFGVAATIVAAVAVFSEFRETNLIKENGQTQLRASRYIELI